MANLVSNPVEERDTEIETGFPDIDCNKQYKSKPVFKFDVVIGKMCFRREKCPLHNDGNPKNLRGEVEVM